MSIKHLPLVFLSSLLLALLFLLIFPNSNIKAVDCNSAPQPYDPNNPNKIQIQNGFLSVTTSDVINQMSLINPSVDKFICGYKAIIPQFAIPNYQVFKNTYYDQAKSTVAAKREYITPSSNPDATQSNLDLTGSKDILYHIKNPNPSQSGGNLTITGPINPGHVLIVFVDGNLTINSNIDTTSGVVFVVNGFIHISPDINHDPNNNYNIHPSSSNSYPPGGDNNYMQINALMMSYGPFCSGWDATGGAGACDLARIKSKLNGFGGIRNDNPLLLINGSVVALSSTTANQPAFVRYIRNNIIPAEQVNFQARYLVNLRKIFSRTRIIYTQIN